MGTWTKPFAILPGQSGGGNLEVGQSEVVIEYQGQYSDNTAGPLDAVNGTGLPAYGARYGFYFLYVLEKSAKQHPKEDTVWNVTVTYRTLKPTTIFPNPATNSHVWQVFRRIDPQPVEIPVQKDTAGKVMVNCIGEPIKPSPTLVVYDEMISIEFLTDLPDRTTIDACKGKVNNSAITISLAGATASYATNTLLFQAPPMQEIKDQDGTTIGKMVYQLLYRKDTWTGLYPNLSYNQLAPGGLLGAGGTNNSPITIGVPALPVSNPQYLSTGGSVLQYGQAVSIVNSGSGYNYISTASFTTLLSGLTT